MVNGSNLDSEQNKKKKDLYLLNRRIRFNNSAMNETNQLFTSFGDPDSTFHSP